MTNDHLNNLLRSLISQCGERDECEWIEFKVDDSNPESIGEYLSALSNAASLHGTRRGYLIWGVENRTHRIVGTSFRPHQTKVGNEKLENWLTTQLRPRIHFKIHEWDEEKSHLVVFEIQPAFHTPVRFKDTEFIRVGS